MVLGQLLNFIMAGHNGLGTRKITGFSVSWISSLGDRPDIKLFRYLALILGQLPDFQLAGYMAFVLGQLADFLLAGYLALETDRLLMNKLAR